ncbi:VapE family protein [Geminicoccaceae bacterium 1502E]|nr:VapE family protein [Geminicoccaceae bacterium 1502E]
MPAIAELRAQGGRWVGWRFGKRGPTGKITKLPIQTTGEGAGRCASSTNPATWASYEACAAYRDANARERGRELAGLGFMLAAERDGIIGIDLDACRDPETGEVAAWAREIIEDLASYAEVSPSGTGVKVFAKADPVPELRANVMQIADVAGHGDKAPHVEVYARGRYFAVTGEHLDGTPDEITDATEALERLVSRVNASAGHEAPRDAQAAGGGPAPMPETEGFPDAFLELLEQNEGLRTAWLSGAKIGPQGKDHSASGKDFSLAIYLAERLLSDDDIAAVLRAYPHGQIGSGALAGRNAERRIEGLLRKAEAAREKAEQRHRRGTDRARWWHELAVNDRGEGRDVIANIVTILRSDPAFAGRLRLDLLKQAVTCSSLPWRACDGWREWSDADDIALAVWCQEREVFVKPGTCAQAVQHVAGENEHHPVREYLDGLRWDGTPRLDTWLRDYLGVAYPEHEAAKVAYLKQAGRRFLISAVARVMRPGCKADHALILEGRERAGKSKAAAVLAVMADWFTDQIADLGTKDSAQDLRGKWLIELGELSAMKRGDVERIKAFMSRSTDHYRASYGRRSTDFPRQCVFIGSTNEDSYLASQTGNRRFWPVRVGRIDTEALRQNREQLWAEAVVAFEAGENWWLDEEVEKAAAVEQDERRMGDPWEEPIAEWLATTKLDEVSTYDILLHALAVPHERQDAGKLKRVGAVMKQMAGWERVQRRRNGSRCWVYERVTSDPDPDGPTGDGTGDGKPAETKAVTSGTTVTSRFDTHSGDTPTTPEDERRGVVVPAPCNFAKPVVTTGDTGDTPASGVTLHGYCDTCGELGELVEETEPGGGLCAECSWLSAREPAQEVRP